MIEHRSEFSGKSPLGVSAYRIFMWTLVQIGSGGVIIILLAELVDRLGGYAYGYEEEQES
jgi:hypothetical protein